jgi:hypothetical protein
LGEHYIALLLTLPERLLDQKNLPEEVIEILIKIKKGSALMLAGCLFTFKASLLIPLLQGSMMSSSIYTNMKGHVHSCKVTMLQNKKQGHFF